MQKKKKIVVVGFSPNFPSTTRGKQTCFAARAAVERGVIYDRKFCKHLVYDFFVYTSLWIPHCWITSRVLCHKFFRFCCGWNGTQSSSWAIRLVGCFWCCIKKKSWQNDLHDLFSQDYIVCAAEQERTFSVIYEIYCKLLSVCDEMILTHNFLLHAYDSHTTVSRPAINFVSLARSLIYFQTWVIHHVPSIHRMQLSMQQKRAQNSPRGHLIVIIIIVDG